MKTGMFILAATLVACGATNSAQKVEVSAYESESLLCVDNAKTLAESHACRDAVKAKFSRLWSDAGTEAGDAAK